jgi:hypothetical protein
VRDAYHPAFDPSRSVAFDLERGHVALSDGEAQLLVPVGPLLSFIAGELDARKLGRYLGVSVSGRVGARFRDRGTAPRDAIRGAPLETVVELLGGELALLGVGNLRVERWGRALLFVLDPCPLDQRADAFLCGIFEGVLTSVSAREVAAVVVDRADGNVRILVGGVGAMAKVEALVHRGAFFTDVVTALHEDGEAATSIR